jgi:transmembrane protein 8A/B
MVLIFNNNWQVTLIAMANIRPSFVSLLHMLGAILLAFGTELNKQSLWVFLAPALTGICIISVSWGMKCRKKKTLYPSKKYLALYLPLGSVLVMIGLVS